MPLNPGDVLSGDKIRIDGVLGQGAFGVVYKAYDTALTRPIAVKELRRDAPGMDSARYDEYVTRFRREAQVQAKFSHPHIVQVYELVEQGATLFLVMEYVEGRTLRDELAARGPLPFAQAVQITLDLLDALREVHAHPLDIVHRDIKPSNVLLSVNGRAKLTDFGLAQVGGESSRSRLGGSRHPGTPLYMSPEQENTIGYLRPASDLYSVGCVLFELLTVKPYKQVDDDPEALRRLRPEAPRELVTILTKALEEDARSRYRRAADFARALRAVQAAEEAARRGGGEREQQAAAERQEAARTAAVRHAEQAAADRRRREPERQRTEEAHKHQEAAERQRQEAAQAEAAAAERRRGEAKKSQQKANRSRTSGRPVWVWAAGLGLVLLCVVGVAIAVWAAGQAQERPAVVAPTTTPWVRPATRTPTPRPSATPTPVATATARPSATPWATAARATGATRTRSIDGMVEVWVPGGSFEMGSEPRHPDELPVRTVTLDGFWLDRTEVSLGQFRRFVAATNHSTQAEQQGWSYVRRAEGLEWTAGADSAHPQGPGSRGQDEHPVVHVSWDDAVAYCEWAGGRLPTEAEWEYAARGSGGHEYPWGNTFDGTRLNYCDKNCPFEWADEAVDDGYATTAPVGTYPAGASWVGALDMAGNVWEWVRDWYGAYPESAQGNPTGPREGEDRVVRGGSWADPDTTLRGAMRYTIPANPLDLLGYRCVRPQSP